jgi:hypothetical protein
MVYGLNFKESASRLGVNVASVKRTVKRILARLPEKEVNKLVMTSSHLMYKGNPPHIIAYSPNQDDLIRRIW